MLQEHFTISLDGFRAGPDQDLSNPLVVGGTSLHGWAIPTRTFQKNLFGNDGGELGVDEVDAALAQAREVAKGKDVRVGGGVKVIQQCLRQRVIDEMHIAIAPVLLGSGERLFEGVDLPDLGYACTKHQSPPLATHVLLTRR